ncbi:MAG: hypothetical protein Q4C58_04055 [Eubacteriales bacterium]|nr:hypothetical protein [Eubacteriales bacterium]
MEILMERHHLHPLDIQIKFTPLLSSKVSKEQNGTLEEKILLTIKKNPYVTQQQIALEIDCSETKSK